MYVQRKPKCWLQFTERVWRNAPIYSKSNWDNILLNNHPPFSFSSFAWLLCILPKLLSAKEGLLLFLCYSINGLKSQHFGRSFGGGISDSLGPFPLSTKNAIFNPHVVCTSKWQCKNHTPVKYMKLVQVNMKRLAPHNH